MILLENVVETDETDAETFLGDFGGEDRGVGTRWSSAVGGFFSRGSLMNRERLEDFRFSVVLILSWMILTFPFEDIGSNCFSNHCFRPPIF